MPLNTINHYCQHIIFLQILKKTFFSEKTFGFYLFLYLTENNELHVD